MSTETFELTADETNAIKLMYYGETSDKSTALRWVAQDQVDEWRRGQIYLLVVSHADRDGLWGTLVKQTWEGESDDLAGQDRVTVQRVYAVPSVTYTLDEPPQAKP